MAFASKQHFQEMLWNSVDQRYESAITTAGTCALTIVLDKRRGNEKGHHHECNPKETLDGPPACMPCISNVICAGCSNSCEIH